MAVFVNDDYEVTVTPEPWQVRLKNALPRVVRKEIFGNKTSSWQEDPGLFYTLGQGRVLPVDTERGDYVLDYIQDASRRLYDIYEEAGSPYLISGTIFPRPGILSNVALGIKDYDTLLNELSHPIQAKHGNNQDYNLKNIVTRWFDKTTDDSLYTDPNEYEYETHEVFYPEIKQYVREGITPEWLNKKQK